MPIILSPEQEAMLDALVSRGDFPNADAALRHALTTQGELAERRRVLIGLIEEGYASFERGEATLFDPDEFLSDVRARRAVG